MCPMRLSLTTTIEDVHRQLLMELPPRVTATLVALETTVVTLATTLAGLVVTAVRRAGEPDVSLVAVASAAASPATPATTTIVDYDRRRCPQRSHVADTRAASSSATPATTTIVDAAQALRMRRLMHRRRPGDTARRRRLPHAHSADRCGEGTYSVPVHQCGRMRPHWVSPKKVVRFTLLGRKKVK